MLKRCDVFNTNRKEYYLLNKDVKVARFHISELGTPVIDNVYTKLPYWLDDLSIFISNRRAPKNRENIEQLLKMSGCDTIEGYLDITHALSLIDTFWVKQIDSPLNWDSVSLFIHEFNETIAEAAFEGKLQGVEFSTTSPEYGTDGSFAKCWVRENSIIKMLKRGSSGARNAGLEPYSEFYASQLVKEFTNHYVGYGLRSRQGKVYSVCDCFTDEQYGYLPYAAIDRGNTSIDKVLRKMDNIGFLDKVKTMFIIDAIIFNEDRHKNNFGFLVDNDKQEILDMAPLFDHNISLLPYTEEEDFHNLEKYLFMKGPRIGDDFFIIAKYCLTPETRKVLIRLKDFEFTRHPKYNLPEWRLKELENLVQRNIRKILE